MPGESKSARLDRLGTTVVVILCVGVGLSAGLCGRRLNAGENAMKEAHPWLHEPPDSTQTLNERFEPPKNFKRLPTEPGSFGWWLRGLPLKPGRSEVRLFDESLKARQDVHAAVLDIDVGRRDLQQCADAAMRLRAEWLRFAGRADDICFKSASGVWLSWKKWRKGYRPGEKSMKKTARPRSGYGAFRGYLDKVFGMVSSRSMAVGLQAVHDTSDVSPGDLFLQPASAGGYGHVVIVMDVAVSPSGQRRILLAQSFMPAQQIHVLVSPKGKDASPWYRVLPGEALTTPEWTFPAGNLYRFKDVSCPCAR